MKRSELGRAGEDSACAWLESRGWKIVARNFRSRRGEIDIIAGKGDTLAFCEVKSWDALGPADLEYAVDRRKVGRIVETSQIFLASNRQYSGTRLRYDLLFVTGGGREVRHLESALTE